MHKSDKETWDASYKAEYNGLVDIDTWELLSEAEYQELKSTVKGLMPTMAIAVIKTDVQGNPVWAKYQIMALGNLNLHN